MKILMIPTSNAPVAFYRMEQFVKGMRKLGHEVAYSYYEHDFTGCASWVKECPEKFRSSVNSLMETADVAVFQSVWSQTAVSYICAIREYFKKPVLAEYDDDIYSISPMSPSWLNTHPGSRAELWQDDHVRMSDGVICSTKYLSEVFHDINPNCYIVPNCLNFEEIWDKALVYTPPKNDKVIRVGWSGGANHNTDLLMVRPAVEAVLSLRDDIEFTLWTGDVNLPEGYKKHPRLRVLTSKHWKSLDEYPSALASLGLDIGICPLRDTTFNRAKSNLKWLEFSALKVPVIASPVRPYLESSKENEDILFAKDTEDWIKQIDKLASNPYMRKVISDRSYRNVKENFNVDHGSMVYSKVLEEVLQKWTPQSQISYPVSQT